MPLFKRWEPQALTGWNAKVSTNRKMSLNNIVSKDFAHVCSGCVVVGDGRIPFYAREADMLQCMYYEIEILEGKGRIFPGVSVGAKNSLK